jgi:hypothetical protein
MTVTICDRCGDVTVDRGLCRCATPHEPIAVRRRHREAVARASSTAGREGPQVDGVACRSGVIEDGEGEVSPVPA